MPSPPSFALRFVTWTLVRAGIVLGALALGGAVVAPSLSGERSGDVEARHYGAEVNPTGSPIGGGPGYARHVAARRPVTSASGLARALDRARAGDVVYVADGAALDLTALGTVRIPAGVTLASGRGRRGSPGALLFTTDPNVRPMLLAAGDDVRVTGLRIRGPETRRLTAEIGAVHEREGQAGMRRLAAARGVMSRHDGLEVDNCELWGWSHAAVFVYGRGRGSTGAHVHHNEIHHNQRRGLGYGVSLKKAEALVEANRFDWNRHSIAGSGDPGTSYEARYNLVGPNANSHAFDMHGGRDRADGTHVAGTDLHVHHNTFELTDRAALRVRGRPERTARVEHNWFYAEASRNPVQQRFATGNLRIGPNAYGRRKRVQ